MLGEELELRATMRSSSYGGKPTYHKYTSKYAYNKIPYKPFIQKTFYTQRIEMNKIKIIIKLWTVNISHLPKYFDISYALSYVL